TDIVEAAARIEAIGGFQNRLVAFADTGVIAQAQAVLRVGGWVVSPPHDRNLEVFLEILRDLDALGTQRRVDRHANELRLYLLKRLADNLEFGWTDMRI